MTRRILAAIVSAIIFMLPMPGHAAKWKIDPASSTITVLATINGATAQGQVNGYVAEIDFDPKHPEAAKISIHIDMTALKMTDPQQTAALGGADWFNTAKFPKAIFTSTSIKATGNNTFEMSATLTLKGKTLPITLPFTFTAKDNKAHATGEFTLMRTDFNIGTGQFASPAIVGFGVKLVVDIIADLAE